AILERRPDRCCPNAFAMTSTWCEPARRRSARRVPPRPEVIHAGTFRQSAPLYRTGLVGRYRAPGAIRTARAAFECRRITGLVRDRPEQRTEDASACALCRSAPARSHDAHRTRCRPAEGTQ